MFVVVFSGQSTPVCWLPSPAAVCGTMNFVWCLHLRCVTSHHQQHQLSCSCTLDKIWDEDLWELVSIICRAPPQYYDLQCLMRIQGQWYQTKRQAFFHLKCPLDIIAFIIIIWHLRFMSITPQCNAVLNKGICRKQQSGPWARDQDDGYRMPILLAVLLRWKYFLIVIATESHDLAASSPLSPRTSATLLWQWTKADQQMVCTVWRGRPESWSCSAVRHWCRGRTTTDKIKIEK